MKIGMKGDMGVADEMALLVLGLWDCARIAPFCDSAPSRESVKRACVSALLRVDGSLFYNV